MHDQPTTEARQYLARRYAAQFEAKGISPDKVPDNFDLFMEGVIDSLGLMELVTDVEREFGLPIDFEDLDAEQVTLFGPLATHIQCKVEQARPASAGGRESKQV